MNLGLLTLGAIALGGTYFGFKKKDPSIQLGSCFFERLAVPLYTFFNEWHSNSGLLIDYIHDDCVSLNTPNNRLYGVELVTGSNIHKYLSKSTINQMINSYKDHENAGFFYVMHKQGKWQRQYVFSYNKTIIMHFADEYDVPLLSGVELANVIYDLFLQNSFSVEDKQIHRNLTLKKQSDEQEPEFVAFKRLARQAIYNNINKINIFQAFRNSERIDTDIIKLFSLNFEGSVWFCFDFAEMKIKNQINKLINETKLAGNKAPFIELKKLYSEGNATLALVNGVCFLKNFAEEVPSSLGVNLKTSFLPKELFRSNAIRKTPLKQRDLDFDFLVETNFVEQFVASIHKKRAKKPDIYGIDRNGGFINFSFSEENDNPHSVIIAKPGSGKSVSKQKIISQMIGLDFANGYASNLGNNPGNVKIRSYDIGFSDENLIRLIMSNPKNKVAHIQSSFYQFKYNLINVTMKAQNYQDLNIEGREIFAADVTFAVDLASLILESSNSAPLTSDEMGSFKKVIEELYIQKQYTRYRIKELETHHKELYEKLLSMGYTQNDYLESIKEKEFDFLKKPLLQDAIKLAGIKSKNMQIKEGDREVLASLASKLSSIDKLDLFSTFDKVDIADADVLSMDLNNFKESSLFTPIFYCIFQKTYLRDREFGLKCKREGRALPKLFYAIEEAKNFFRDNKTFEQMFDKVTLEARKYNVHLCFIVQNAEHLPKFILKNINTRMFLLNPSVKLEVIEEADSAFAISNDIKEALANTQKYEICVWYKGGVFNMKFDISADEMKVFSTNPNEV